MENEQENSYSGDPNYKLPEAPPERGGCLTALLILMMISAGFTILMYLFLGEKIARKAHIPEWAPYLMIFFSLLHLLFAYLSYQWKKAGVIGIVINGAAVLIANLALGLGPTSFLGLVGIVILIVLVNPVWQHFK